MKKVIALVALGAGALLVAGAPSAFAKGKMSCVKKAGRGWGESLPSARFQAWEAVLQSTDWGMWAVWMGSGAKVGRAASGYRVRNLREKCGNDNGLKVCTIRARLCK